MGDRHWESPWARQHGHSWHHQRDRTLQLEVLSAALSKGRRRIDACEGFLRLGDAAAVPALTKLSHKLFLAWPERLTVLGTLYALGERDAGQGVVARTRALSREERGFAISIAEAKETPLPSAVQS